MILTNDNIFTKAACAGKVGELSIAVMNAVKSDLAKLEEIASLTAQDIIAGVDDEEIKEILLTLPGWEVGKALAPLDKNWDKQIDELVNIIEKTDTVFTLKILRLLGEMRKSHLSIQLILFV